MYGPGELPGAGFSPGGDGRVAAHGAVWTAGRDLVQPLQHGGEAVVEQGFGDGWRRRRVVVRPPPPTLMSA